MKLLDVWGQCPALVLFHVTAQIIMQENLGLRNKLVKS